MITIWDCAQKKAAGAQTPLPGLPAARGNGEAPRGSVEGLAGIVPAKIQRLYPEPAVAALTPTDFSA